MESGNIKSVNVLKPKKLKSGNFGTFEIRNAGGREVEVGEAVDGMEFSDQQCLFH